MQKLSTIQKRENMNDVYRTGEKGPGGAYHEYVVASHEGGPILEHIFFQKGPRKDDKSMQGVLDCDLLEIVRDRLTAFQKGDMATEYNHQALIHVEEALMWMNRRVEDRIERQVLGTMEK